MTREEAIKQFESELKWAELNIYPYVSKQKIEADKMAIKALQAWDKFKQALDKRILEQGFDEDEWSVSYNELIKMMKKCGGVE